MISKKAIDEFKNIYREEFGIVLSDNIAMEDATRFMNLFKVIYKPIDKLTNENKSGTI